MAEALSPHLVGDRPNSYTFTKSVAEALVSSYGIALMTAFTVTHYCRKGLSSCHRAAFDHRIDLEGPDAWMGGQLQWLVPLCCTVYVCIMFSDFNDHGGMQLEWAAKPYIMMPEQSFHFCPRAY